jgi:hypothetical protein
VVITYDGFIAVEVILLFAVGAAVIWGFSLVFDFASFGGGL